MSKRGFRGEAWCVAGDFNAVSVKSERRRISSHIGLWEIVEFNQFILEMNIVDIPVLGKKFMWFSADGGAMSRLDRFLLSESLISAWQVNAQWVGDHDISDHCPIWIVCSSHDWGPKPFQFNKCWLEHDNFKSFVEERWGSFQMSGWKIHGTKRFLGLWI